MSKKVRVLGSVAVATMLCVVVLVGYFHQNTCIIDEQIPLANGYVASENENDIQPIPDKYNTGCDETKLSTTVNTPGTYSGVEVSEYGTSLAIRMKEKFSQTIVIENVDFSQKDFVLANEAAITTSHVVRFVNCKFSSLRISDIGDTKVQHIFENCSFVHFAGSNATFESCYFGDGSQGDGINPYRNCTFNNCMIANLVHPSQTGESNHVDGFQVFGDSSANNLDIVNIHLNNCRFEVPYIPYSQSAGLLNCPITFTMRYSNASDVSFTDCIVNGGQYYSIMLYSDDYSLNNVSLQNIRVGGNRKSANITGDSLSKVLIDNVYDTPTLYVGSVWKDAQGIHLSVTNDTNQERKLKVYTSNGTYEQTIAACPVSSEIGTDTMDYEDFPFDMDICIEDADWVVCFDVTSGESEQIRFVNWSGSCVVVELENEETVDSIENSVSQSSGSSSEATVVQGICGDSVNYQLSGGQLSLAGQGATYSYNSSKPAPWYDYKDTITSIVIGEGITVLDDQLFAECSKVTEIVIPEGVTTIGGNAFIKNRALTTVSLPESLESIGRYAFASTAVSQIVYAGDSEKWAAISIGDKNDVLYSANIEYQNEKSAVLWSGSCGEDVVWTIYKNGLLEIVGTGAIDNYNSVKTAPWDEYKLEIRKVVISEGVTQIGSQAFASCTNLDEVICPKGLTVINNNAFIKCKSLTKITLYNDLEKIERYAFAGTNLLEIHYFGSEEEWNKIYVASNNENLMKATIIWEK